jgi:glycyl-tRNA synthetase alpha chain
MEITQFTYFQQVGGIECQPVSAELTYGIERIATYLQDVDDVFDLEYSNGVSYSAIFRQPEFEHSKYTFEVADTELLFRHFNDYEKEANRALEQRLVFPAYDYVLKCSHTFNQLDAAGAISVSARASFIGRVRNIAQSIAKLFLEERCRMDFPLMKDREVAQKWVDKLTSEKQ